MVNVNYCLFLNSHFHSFEFEKISFFSKRRFCFFAFLLIFIFLVCFSRVVFSLRHKKLYRFLVSSFQICIPLNKPNSPDNIPTIDMNGNITSSDFLHFIHSIVIKYFHRLLLPHRVYLLFVIFHLRFTFSTTSFY